MFPDEQERRLALRLATMFAVPLALVVLVPMVGLTWAYDHAENQAGVNKALMQRIERLEQICATPVAP